MVQINEDLKARMITMTQQEVQWFRDNAPEEQRNLARQVMQDARNNEEVKAQKMAQYNEWWAQADANGDGLLNKEEWLAFRAAQMATRKAEGHFAEVREGANEAAYELLNEISPDRDGISKEEFFVSLGVFAEATAAMGNN